MTHAGVMCSSCEEFDSETSAFYRRVLEILKSAEVPFLVGGAYAFSCYTGSQRPTKDLDLFVLRDDYKRIETLMRAEGYEAELTFPHWLAKVYGEDAFIDIIFSSGNGIAEVDERWFEYANDAEVLGVPVKITPIEEMIWSKAFIMERERYDGADIAHLFRICEKQMDWQRLLDRFGVHWRVLLSHMILFGFVYPAELALIPQWAMNRLMDRLRHETEPSTSSEKICQGTLLSREQYLQDVEQQGYQDGRLAPYGSMTVAEVTHWTNAIPERHKHSEPHGAARRS